MNYVDALTGYVGIGTSAPTAPLHVRANTSNTGVVIDQVGTGATFEAKNAGVSKVMVDANGNVGIGTTNPTFKLDVYSASPVIANFKRTTGTITNASYLYVKNGDDTASCIVGVDGVGLANVSPGAAFLGSVQSLPVVFATALTERMRIAANGNVGIGVPTPLAPLHVSGNIHQPWGDYRFGIFYDNSFRQGINYYAAPRQMNIFSCSGDTGGDITFSTIGGFVGTNDSNYGTTRMTIRGNGYVGIGNTNPQFPLDVIGSSVQNNLTGVYFNYGNVTSSFTNLSGWPVSIKANNYIWTTYGFVASSDTRIKTNIQDINDETALAQLRLIQPKTYEYIDKVQRGSDQVIGFIAQEVAEVIPRAVTKQKEIIPSVYAIASVIDSALQLEKEHGFVVGDTIKLILEEGGEIITKVKEVISPMSFTIEDSLTDARVFVYGKEVPDFHTLDKNAIFTIGVAAVQELDRQVQQLRAQNATILERLAAIEQRMA